MIGLLTTFPIQERPSSVGVYRELQARLAHASSVRLTVIPGTRQAWDHEGEFGYLRPGKGFRHEPNLGFATDGRQSWGMQIENEVMKVGKKSRATKPDDPKNCMVLPGFESFFDPKAVVSGDVPPAHVKQGNVPCLALDLTIDSAAVILYLNEKTGLPLGWAYRQKGGDSAYLYRYYQDIRLNAPIPAAFLKVDRANGPQRRHENGL